MYSTWILNIKEQGKQNARNKEWWYTSMLGRQYEGIRTMEILTKILLDGKAEALLKAAQDLEEESTNFMVKQMFTKKWTLQESEHYESKI